MGSKIKPLGDNQVSRQLLLPSCIHPSATPLGSASPEKQKTCETPQILQQNKNMTWGILEVAHITGRPLPTQLCPGLLNLIGGLAHRITIFSAKYNAVRKREGNSIKETS